MTIPSSELGEKTVFRILFPYKTPSHHLKTPNKWTKQSVWTLILLYIACLVYCYFSINAIFTKKKWHLVPYLPVLHVFKYFSILVSIFIFGFPKTDFHGMFTFSVSPIQLPREKHWYELQLFSIFRIFPQYHLILLYF